MAHNRLKRPTTPTGVHARLSDNVRLFFFFYGYKNRHQFFYGYKNERETYRYGPTQATAGELGFRRGAVVLK
jgi:hypothetical protein